MAFPTRSTELDTGHGWNVADPAGVRRRAFGCGLLLLLAFGGLIGRLWYLQVVRGPDMLAKAQSNRLRRVPRPAPRGLILDRNGQVLATSRAQHSIAVVPAALPSARREPQERARIIRTLGFLLGISPQAIEARIAEKEGGQYRYNPVKIAEDVDLRTVTLISENEARLGGDRRAVLVTNDLARYYPNHALACHVLGYTGIVTDEDLTENQHKLADFARTSPEYDPETEGSAPESDVPNGDNPNGDTTPAEGDAQTLPVTYGPGAGTNAPSIENPVPRQLGGDDIIGKSGIERRYDDILCGQSGAEVFEVDARSRPIRQRGTEPEQPGATLRLTIDLKLQRAAEAALGRARNSGAVVAIDPRNGDVLVLASRPGFDPNIWSQDRRAFSEAYRRLLHDPKHPLINRAVSSRFPPGSTFKMVTASAGMQRGTLNPQAVVVCNGGLRLGRWFGCWGHHGAVDLQTALAKSCDVYFYQQALRLGNPESSGPTYLASVARRFGLGQRTGIDLPIDGAGLIPDPAWRARINAGHPDLARWFPGNTLNMSIGQGDVLVTPLQLALATGAVANGGTLYTPHLLRSIRDPRTGREEMFQPHGERVGIERRYLDLVRDGMRAVVTRGTGKPVALPQVEIAGKTGSAEDDAHGMPHAWFVSFAPYRNPSIAIAVIVENSGHGSENAAPIAKAIFEAAFPPSAAPAASATPRP